jgi:hypothetical protein
MSLGIPRPEPDGREVSAVVTLFAVDGLRFSPAILLALAFACDRSAPSKVPVDRKAEEAIRAEARAFYRDLASQDTPALLNHFWPAKIAARWEPPFESAAPRRTPLLSTAIVSRAPQGCDAGAEAMARAELRIERPWARAMVPRCAEGSDELWFLEFDGSWKIVRLSLAAER